MDYSKEISAELTQEQYSFLADFEKQCQNSSISKSSVMRCLLKLIQEVDANIGRVETEDELLQCFLKALKLFPLASLSYR